MITMCKPEIDRTWNSPEARNAALVSSEIPPRSPVMSALAMAPGWPGSTAVMRWPIA